MIPRAKPNWWPEKQMGRHPFHDVLVCGHQLHPPVFSHMVNFPRLEVPLAGCYENQIEADRRITTVRLKPGTVLFAPPNCWNFPVWEQKVELLSLLFGVKQIGISVVTSSGSRRPQLKSQKTSLPCPLTGALPHILAAMLETRATGGIACPMPALAQALVQCVQAMLKAAPPDTDATRSQSLFDNICIYLQSHYQYNITRESVARQFGISPTHLSRIFRARGHMTFTGYLTHVRMDRAKHLLQNYDFKLDEIAARCGYHYAPYFCQIFKRMTKITPAQYRVRTQLAKRE